MNKGDLAARVSQVTGLSRKSAASALDAALLAIREALSEGETVRLVGFGTFGVREMAPRTGRNPRTNEEVRIPGRRVPVFRAGRALRDAVLPDDGKERWT